MAIILYSWMLLFSATQNSLLSSPSKVNFKHPYYVSVTELNHNAKEQIVEISCKIFTNDLETLLRSKTKGYVDIVHPKDKAATGKLINDYISKHLQIIIDGRSYQLEYLGYEIEDEAVWSYLQIKNISSVKKVQITNTILYDYKKEQINLMHVSVKGERKSTKLSNPETSTTFDF